uniref:RNA polymerase sigma factor n=1 Tax=Agathobacter sp. TaxID=2021311 RepID=UPI0040576994
MNIDINEQYDKIYRYCYFKVKNQHLAEDITQETFLRFFERTTSSRAVGVYEEAAKADFGNPLSHSTYKDAGRPLAYLYTIARNLCVDEFRRVHTEELKEDVLQNGFEEAVIEKENLHQAMAELKKEEQELLLLRYVNEVSFSDLSKLYKKSRFALYRELSKITKKLERRISDGA